MVVWNGEGREKRKGGGSGGEMIVLCKIQLSGEEFGWGGTSAE